MAVHRLCWYDSLLNCTGLTKRDGSSLPELRVQYADYAAAGNSNGLESAEREQLADRSRELEPPRLPMPELLTDRARPAVRSYRGARHDFLLPRELWVKLRALGQRENVTPFSMVLLSAFQALLAGYTGRMDKEASACLLPP